MPIYEYRCERGHTFEVMQRMTDDPLTSCSTCEAPVQRVFHPVAVHFKGSGFYNTDYGKKKGGGLSRPPSRSRRSSESKSESKDSKSSKDSELLVGSSSSSPPRTSSPFSSLSTASRLAPSETNRLLPLIAAGGLEHLGLVGVAGGHVGEQGHQRRALHVGLERLGRLPADPGAAGRRCSGEVAGVADRAQHLLLARGAVAVVLARARTGSCARARSRAPACRSARSRPCGSVSPFQKLSNGGEQMRVLLLTVMPPSESISSGKSSKSTSTRWLISRPLPRKSSTVSIVSAGAAERVGGVDLVGAVAGDLGLDVARDRELAHAAERGVDEHDRVRARGAALALVDRLAGARVGAEHEDRAAGEQVAAARQRALGLVRDALLELGADQEERRARAAASRAPPSATHLSTRPGVIRLRSRGARGLARRVTRLSRRLRASRSVRRARSGRLRER